MKPLIFLWLALAVCGSSAWAELTLAKSGKPRCVIIQQAKASAPEQHAIAELALHLNLITGAKFEVKTNAIEVPKNAIIVGQGSFAAKLFPEIDLAKFGPEEFVMRTKGDRLLLAGGRPRGTIYAVNRFLQEQFGVRWWTPWATNIPYRATLRIPDLNVRETPAFEYREPFWFQGFDPLWKSRNGANGENRHIPAELGGSITYKGFCHTFYPLVPPAQHFAAHPEWYSLINGKRTHERGQLCLSNRELRRFMVERVKAWLRETPDATIISVTQNDCAGACECPKCKAIDDAEGSPSGSMLAFVNYVASKIEAEFPRVAVDTFAYQYTRKPPQTIKPRPNVIVRLCSIEGNFREPLNHPSNAAFLEDLGGWSRICNRLYIWDYTTDFKNYVNPHPNWFTLGANVRLFEKYGVRGVFEQGAYQGWGGEMGELRVWLLAQLLWNPQQDDHALIQEFLVGYYGKAAAKPIGRYLDLMHDASEGFYLGCFAKPNPPHLEFKILNEAEQLWQKAEKAVGKSPELLARVRLSHLPVRHAFLRDWERLRQDCREQDSDWPLPESRKTVAEEFREACKGVSGKEWTQVRTLNEQGLKVDEFLKPFAVDPPPPTDLKKSEARGDTNLQVNVASPARSGDSAIRVKNSKNSISLTASSPALQLHLEATTNSASLVRLGWDTEGTGRSAINLLKSPVELRLSRKGQVLTPPVRFEVPDTRTLRYNFGLADGIELTWEITVQTNGLRMQMAARGDVSTEVDKLELVFPFEPRTTMTSVISSRWTEAGTFQLPAIISAPDLGQMLVKSAEPSKVAGRIEGSRKQKWITTTFELPIPGQSSAINLEFSPVRLPMPIGFKDEKRWQAARRGWFNFIQQSCGASGGGTNVLGVWANNALSDPVSSLVHWLGDATLLVPELATGVSMTPILRRTLDYWIDFKTDPDGLVAYTAGGEKQNVMDANPSVLIGVWCYVKATSDREWLQRRIGRLEFLSRYMENRDVDGDGLIECKQSGNSGSRPPRDPDCAWDCYASGHKNACVNVLAYRAWQGLAELEGQLGRQEQAQRYRQLADRLKTSFLKTFYNPDTGWLGWWRSRDGQLHDIHTDTATSLAISYGLIDKAEGRKMLQRYWQALEKTGFKRFDLGVPLNLQPLPREEMEHYTEFQQFLNGGCAVANTSPLLEAMYLTGMKKPADMILEAMLKRQQDGVFPNGGGFQNGFVDRMGQGAEVFDWNGKPAGYEGHLVYCWSFLHSMLLREAGFRDRVRIRQTGK